MMSLTDSQQSSEAQQTIPPQDAMPELGQEFVFVQDRAGRVLSFSWQQSSEYGADSSKEVAVGDLATQFSPVDPVAYNEKLQQVLNSCVPESCQCHFRWGDRLLVLNLTISPILLPDRPPSSVVVAGKATPSPSHPVDPEHLGGNSPVGTAPIPYSAIAPSSDRYQKLLTQIAWNIRRTLDLPTIWQQTVQGLGKALGVSRCIVCPYEALSPKIKVVAEYCPDSFPSMMNEEFWVDKDPYLKQAITTLKPVAVPELEGTASTDRECEHRSALMIATCYQDQPNGLIVLHQCDRVRLWTEAELELMQDLANQVGTAIAHATLLARSQSLATELQRTNSTLLQKHRELEEARKQAEEASRLKSEFLANTSHELRTPLNGIIGFLKLIMEGMADDPEEQSEFIHESYRSSLHLLDIINDVLDIARIEAGSLEIDLNPLKLDELLDDVYRAFHQQVEEKGLYFEIQKPPTRDQIILYGNYQRLKQVMFNLIGNAVKFTHEGGITVSIEVIRKKAIVQNQEFPGMVKVRVADTGIGVSLDKQDRLFQSFSQIDGSRTRQYGGTGLGLAISQKLIEAMGGVVNFYSMGEGLGSTVTFTVPLYQEPLMIE